MAVCISRAERLTPGQPHRPKTGVRLDQLWVVEGDLGVHTVVVIVVGAQLTKDRLASCDPLDPEAARVAVYFVLVSDLYQVAPLEVLCHCRAPGTLAVGQVAAMLRLTSSDRYAHQPPVIGL